MNNTMGLAIFALGACVGAAVAWVYAKKRFEGLIDEEVASVKEAFSGREVSSQKEVTEEKPEVGFRTREKPDISHYTQILREEKYVEKEAAYIITAEEFGELDGYDTISLTYYADGILADDADEIVSDANDIVGEVSLGSFDEYDEIFVRNERLRCDYEICLDTREYETVTFRKPHQMEG